MQSNMEVPITIGFSTTEYNKSLIKAGMYPYLLRAYNYNSGITADFINMFVNRYQVWFDAFTITAKTHTCSLLQGGYYYVPLAEVDHTEVAKYFYSIEDRTNINLNNSFILDSNQSNGFRMASVGLRRASTSATKWYVTSSALRSQTQGATITTPSSMNYYPFVQRNNLPYPDNLVP